MGAALLAIGYAMPAVYLIWSLLPGGRRAPANPWGASGLEWTTSSPPPQHNFIGQPVVVRQPYDYPLAHPVSRDDG